MKLAVFSIMRNEAAILPYWLRHYDTIADRIWVWDDGSDDGTRELLAADPKVTILEPQQPGLDDGYFVRTLWPQARRIARHHDWIACVDADEFVWHPRLEEALDAHRELGETRLRLDGWAMYHPTFPTTEGQIYDEVRLGWPDRWSSKPVLFTPDRRMAWTTGRHYCIGDAAPSGIRLLHFRWLGWQYFLSRSQRNHARMGLEYREGKHYNLPDGTRGRHETWFEANAHKAVNVLEQAGA